MGSLGDFSNADGTLNPAALVQATALLNCMQNNDRMGAQALLQQVGSARILVWTWFPETLPPDLCVIIDGSDMYVVVIGTMNPEQWLAQIAGATATPYPPQPAVSAGAFWLPISHDLNVTLAGLAVPGITRLKLVGHSYGGAVALLTGLNFAQNPGQLADVQVLVVGAPNPLTGGYTGMLPSALHRVALPGDIVPILPPAGFDARVPFRVGVDAAFGYGPRWAYYGRGWRLEVAGGLTPDSTAEPTLTAALAAIADGNLTIHQIGNYTAAAVATYQRLSGDPRVNAWLPPALVQAAAPNPQTPPPPIAQATWVDVPGANAVYFPPGQSLITRGILDTIQSVSLNISNVEVQRSANIQHVSQGSDFVALSSFKRVTFISNNDLYGRLYSMTLNQSGSFASCLAAAQVVAAKLAGCFGNSLTVYTVPPGPFPYPQSRGTPTVDFVRISDALNPRVSQLFNLGGVNYAGLPAGLPADFVSTSLSMRLRGVSSQVVPPSVVPADFSNAANLLIVGQPDAAVAAGSYVPDLSLGGGLTLDGQILRLLNLITGGPALWGFMGLDYTQRLQATSPWVIFNVTFWKFTAPGHNWATGDRIRITGANSIGFNGVYKVQVIDVDNVYLTNGPRVTLPAPTQANARRIQAADGTRFRVFYRYQAPADGFLSPFGIKISKKNPGRRFTGVSFTKRKRRPK